MNRLNEEHEDFLLTFEVAIIEHLGLNLYSEVHSAISELIANAYDADASVVDVTIPTNQTLGLTGQTITISDNGHGMRYAEARDNYLRIGRNRRKATGSNKSRSGNRKVIGKKGIGKLAGFGIADEIRVRTVSSKSWPTDAQSAGQSYLTEFVLNLDAIRKAPLTINNGDAPDEVNAPDVTREYRPELIHVDDPTNLPCGTTITLQKIRPLDEIDFDDFIIRLTRKFAVFDSNFKVTIYPAGGEGKTLSRFDLPCQFRFPEPDGGPYVDGWLVDFIETPNAGKKEVRYWIGFAAKPIKKEAERGITVIAGGKQVQEAFDFKITGGTTGQFGLQYVTGQVEANWLDEGAIDVIASDRASVRWSDPNASALLKWGKEKLKNLLSAWIDLRTQRTKEIIEIAYPEIEAEVDSYSGEAKDELRRVVDRVAAQISDVEEERRMEVIRSIVTSYRHEHVQKVLRRIIDLPSDADLDLFIAALKEWELVDAVLTYQDLVGKAEVLQTFGILVLGKATEVKSKTGNLSLHEHLARYPWLLDPAFDGIESEIEVDKFFLEKYGHNPSRTPDEFRADFIVLYRADEIRVIEIKSAHDPIDARGILKLQTYHERAKEAIAGRGMARSMLIYNGKVTAEAEGALKGLKRDAEIEVYTWHDLLRRNTLIYKEMLERIRLKNPTDPRIQVLYEIYKNRLGAASSAADRARTKILPSEEAGESEAFMNSSEETFTTGLDDVNTE